LGWKTVWVTACAASFLGVSGERRSMAETTEASAGDAKVARKHVKEPAPDPMAEIEKLRADFEKRLEEQEASAKSREEALKKEEATAVEAVREEAEKSLAADRVERQAETIRLQKALEAAAAREDQREKDAAPAVGGVRGLSLYGYVQADYQLRQSSEDQLNPTSGTPLNEDRFLIRRARLGVLFERRYGEGRVEVDGNTVSGTTLGLVDAEASVKLPGRVEGEPPLAKATLGSFRIPFGFETPQDDRERFFLERTTASRAFFPGQYDLGARLAGGWQFVRYAIAVQNGQPLGGNQFPGLDPNHQKDILGRLGVESTIRRKVDIVAGVSALRGTGFHSGSLASKSTVQWNDTDENGKLTASELNGSPAIAAGPSSSFVRFGFGADMLLTGRLLGVGKTTVGAEFYLANNLDRGVFPADPNNSAIGRNLREIGYYLSLTQQLGRFMLGARFDYYNPDQDSNMNSKGSPVPTDVSYATLAAAGACMASWGRFIIEYDRNWNHLGIDFNGMPSNLKDDALIARGEVRF
jgi:hypothetical protein